MGQVSCCAEYDYEGVVGPLGDASEEEMKELHHVGHAAKGAWLNNCRAESCLYMSLLLPTHPVPLRLSSSDPWTPDTLPKWRCGCILPQCRARRDRFGRRASPRSVFVLGPTALLSHAPPVDPDVVSSSEKAWNQQGNRWVKLIDNTSFMAYAIASRLEAGIIGVPVVINSGGKTEERVTLDVYLDPLTGDVNANVSMFSTRTALRCNHAVGEEVRLLHSHEINVVVRNETMTFTKAAKQDKASDDAATIVKTTISFAKIKERAAVTRMTKEKYAAFRGSPFSTPVELHLTPCVAAGAIDVGDEAIFIRECPRGEIRGSCSVIACDALGKYKIKLKQNKHGVFDDATFDELCDVTKPRSKVNSRAFDLGFVSTSGAAKRRRGGSKSPFAWCAASIADRFALDQDVFDAAARFENVGIMTYLGTRGGTRTFANPAEPTPFRARRGVGGVNLEHRVGPRRVTAAFVPPPAAGRASDVCTAGKSHTWTFEAKSLQKDGRGLMVCRDHDHPIWHVTIGKRGVASGCTRRSLWPFIIAIQHGSSLPVGGLRGFVIEGKIAGSKMSPRRWDDGKEIAGQGAWQVLYEREKVKNDLKGDYDLTHGYERSAFRIEPSKQCWVTAIRLRMTERNQSQCYSLCVLPYSTHRFVSFPFFLSCFRSSTYIHLYPFPHADVSHVLKLTVLCTSLMVLLTSSTTRNKIHNCNVHKMP